MRRVLAILIAHPWLLPVVVLIIAIIVLEFRHAADLRSLRAHADEKFQEAIKQLDAQRETTASDLAAVSRQRDALKREVDANRQALALLSQRSQVADQAVARGRQSADELLAHPSCVALLAAAQRLDLKSFQCR